MLNESLNRGPSKRCKLYRCASCESTRFIQLSGSLEVQKVDSKLTERRRLFITFYCGSEIALAMFAQLQNLRRRH